MRGLTGSPEDMALYPKRNEEALRGVKQGRMAVGTPGTSSDLHFEMLVPAAAWGRGWGLRVGVGTQ